MRDPLPEEAYIDQVRSVIADVMDLAPEDVGPDDDLFLDLGVESLSLASIYVFLKRYMGAPEPVDREHYKRLSTPRRIANYVYTHARNAP